MNKEEILKNLGNPGIWGYCKESEYANFLQQLDERGYFNDLERSGGKIADFGLFKDFQYNDSITKSDFSDEPFSDDDRVIGLWCVEKKHQKVNA